MERVNDQDIPRVMSWLSLSRAAESTTEPVARLEKDPVFMEAALEWLGTKVPKLGSLMFNIWANDYRAMKSEARIYQEENADTFVSLDCGVKVAPVMIDPVGEDLLMIRAAEIVLTKTGTELGITSEPPSVSLTETEREWLQAHGDPKLRIGKVPLTYHWRTNPEDRQQRQKPRFDVWQLFPGTEPDPLRFFIQRHRAMPAKQRVLAAASVNWHIDSYLTAWSEGTESCITDSEAIHAAALLCGGRELWDQAVADPASFDEVWPTDDDAEEILMITDWS